MRIVYVGPSAEVEDGSGRALKHGIPTEVSDALGTALIAERPAEFHLADDEVTGQIAAEEKE